MTVIQAKQYVLDKVILPASESNLLSTKVKDVTRNQIPWISNFNKIGDLHRYLVSITRTKDASVDELTSLNFDTFESILPEFEERYSDYLNDITNFDDFEVGKCYSSRDLLSVVGNYDTRSGGIQLYKAKGQLQGIAIKVTLKGGKYDNDWLIDGEVLKYYMKSIKGVFKESYGDNTAIINSHDLPIYTFVRENGKDKKFTYRGVFKYLDSVNEGNEKWFKLARSGSKNAYSLDEINRKFLSEVETSSNMSSSKRKERLLISSKKPKTRSVLTVIYERNPDVVAEVLKLAKGFCGICKKSAPFNRRKNKTPYLEVHHKTRLADGGDDTIENAVALCPNCHREEHYG